MPRVSTLGRATVVVALVCCLAIWPEAAFTAAGPPGGPDPKDMALQLSDFPTGAKIDRQAYAKSQDCVSSYDRAFDLEGARTARLLHVMSQICVVSSVDTARATFTAMAKLLSGKSGRDVGRAIVVAAAEGEDVTRVRVKRNRTLRVGDGGFELAIAARVEGLSFELSLVFVRTNRVLGTLVLVGVPGRAVTAGDVTRLAGIFSGRIKGGLVPIRTGPPAISGSAQEGQVLSATPGVWRNRPTRLAYQWKRCDSVGTNCADIPGATGPTYTLAAADVGFTISIGITAANPVGAATGVAIATRPVVPVNPPTSAAAPAISGTAEQGQTLTATPGTWTGAPTGYAYQWQRCDAHATTCADVAAATSQTYGLSHSDAGFAIRVVVTATNAVGPVTAASLPTAIVR